MKTTYIFLHNFRCSGNSINLAIRNYFMGDHVKLGVVKEQVVSHSALLESCRIKQPKFILGHNVFGLHKQFDFPCRYFVNFRDPIDRLVSGFATWSKVQYQDIIQYYQDHEERSNGMTYRMLGFGKNPDTGRWYDFHNNSSLKHLPQIDDSLFSEALENLNREVDAALISEHYCQSLVNFERQLSLPPLVCPQGMTFNQNKTFVETKHFSKQIIDILEEENRWDRQLYNEAVKLLNRQVSEQDDSFLDDVRIRQILDSMMKIKGTDVLDDQLVINKLKMGINTLLHLGMKQELVAVIDLFISSVSINQATARSIIELLNNVLDKDDLGRLTNTLTQKSAA